DHEPGNDATRPRFHVERDGAEWCGGPAVSIQLPPMNPETTPPEPGRREPGTTSLRAELLVILALTVVAAVPRFYNFGREGLTHFDEGVYALAGLWSLSPRGLAG